MQTLLSILTHESLPTTTTAARYLYKGDVILDNALILVAGMFLGIVYYGDPWYSSPLPKRAFTGCPLGTCTTHLIIPLYTPCIHPLYTFTVGHTPVYTRYTCIYTIYTPNTPLNTSKNPIYTLHTPYVHPV